MAHHATNPFTSTIEPADALASAERTEQDAAQALSDAQAATRDAWGRVSAAVAKAAEEAAEAGATAKATAAAKAAARQTPEAEHRAAKAAEDKARLALGAAKAATRDARTINAAASARPGDDKAVDWPTATQAFLNDARGVLAWVSDRDRWAVWNGRCWAFDAKGSRAALVAQRWVRDCAEPNGHPALRTRARAHHELLDHAKGPLLRAFRDFDGAAVAHLLTCANGTIDLRTGALLPHDPAHLITRESPVRYDPDATGEWQARLLEIFLGDAALADWFRREIGMGATGFTQAKRVYLLLGDLSRPENNGDNGKSLVVDTIRAALGSYVGGIKSALLCRASFDRDANAHDAGRQGLIGNRLALGAEFPTGAKLNDAEFNEISGGEPIRARMPNQPDEIEFPAQATVAISANTVPALGTANRSTRERLTPVPFHARFYKPGEPMPAGGLRADYGLKARLAAEQEQRAVLAWIVSGARDFYALGTPAPLPQAVLDLKATIFAAQDPWADFIDDNIVADPAGFVAAGDLWAIFDQVNERTGVRRPKATEAAIAASIVARGAKATDRTKTSGSNRGWHGVSLTPDAAKVLKDECRRARHARTTVAPLLRVVAPAPAPVQADDDREPMGDGLPEWQGYVSEPDDLTDPDGEPLPPLDAYAAILAECEARGNA